MIKVLLEEIPTDSFTLMFEIYVDNMQTKSKKLLFCQLQIIRMVLDKCSDLKKSWKWTRWLSFLARINDFYGDVVKCWKFALKNLMIIWFLCFFSNQTASRSIKISNHKKAQERIMQPYSMTIGWKYEIANIIHPHILAWRV